MASQLITVEEATSVLAFWFEELAPQQWFRQDEGLDAMIRSRFSSVHDAACRCELWPWRATPHGRLAEIIVLDQFSRNLYRNQARAFAADPMALALAQEALRVEAEQSLTLRQMLFLYMPFMHSESMEIHDIALELFSTPGMEEHLVHEQQHYQVLQQFGRYPQRNDALGRTSSEAELAFLARLQSGEEDTFPV